MSEGHRTPVGRFIVPLLGVDTRRHLTLFWAEAHFTAHVLCSTTKTASKKHLARTPFPRQRPTTSQAQCVSEADPQLRSRCLPTRHTTPAPSRPGPHHLWLPGNVLDTLVFCPPHLFSTAAWEL